MAQTTLELSPTLHILDETDTPTPFREEYSLNHNASTTFFLTVETTAVVGMSENHARITFSAHSQPTWEHPWNTKIILRTRVQSSDQAVTIDDWWQGWANDEIVITDEGVASYTYDVPIGQQISIGASGQHYFYSWGTAFAPTVVETIKVVDEGITPGEQPDDPCAGTTNYQQLIQVTGIEQQRYTLTFQGCDGTITEIAQLTANPGDTLQFQDTQPQKGTYYLDKEVWDPNCNDGAGCWGNPVRVDQASSINNPPPGMGDTSDLFLEATGQSMKEILQDIDTVLDAIHQQGQNGAIDYTDIFNTHTAELQSMGITLDQLQQQGEQALLDYEEWILNQEMMVGNQTEIINNQEEQILNDQEEFSLLQTLIDGATAIDQKLQELGVGNQMRHEELMDKQWTEASGLPGDYVGDGEHLPEDTGLNLIPDATLFGSISGVPAFPVHTIPTPLGAFVIDFNKVVDLLEQYGPWLRAFISWLVAAGLFHLTVVTYRDTVNNVYQTPQAQAQTGIEDGVPVVAHGKALMMSGIIIAIAISLAAGFTAALGKINVGTADVFMDPVSGAPTIVLDALRLFNIFIPIPFLIFSVTAAITIKVSFAISQFAAQAAVKAAVG